MGASLRPRAGLDGGRGRAHSQGIGWCEVVTLQADRPLTPEQQAIKARVDIAKGLKSVPRIEVDPVTFARTVLGHDVWDIPERIMAAIAKPHARVAVKGCHASSKTFSAAEIVLWWVHQGGMAVTTAPRMDQVRLALWSEIHRAVTIAKRPLGGELLQTEYRLSADAFAIGTTSNEGVKFQGFHGKRFLFVVDEAPGVSEDIFTAMEGAAAGGDVRILMLGNPDASAGPFYDAFGPHSAGVERFTIDAFETPNLRGHTIETLLDWERNNSPELDADPFSYLVTRRWVLGRYHKWGVDSPLWQSRVRGQFPAQSIDAVYPLAHLEQAQKAADDDGLPCVAGVDVAGPGKDETALCVRTTGGVVLHQQAWSTPDARGDVAAALLPFARAGRLRVANIDSAGMGWYFAQHLRDVFDEEGLPVRVEEVNVGTSPYDRERFLDRKAEVYWFLRDELAAGRVSNLTDDDAYSQLSTLRYQHDSHGRIVIESKDAIRKRGSGSPDRAEAVILAFIPEYEYGQPVLPSDRPRLLPAGAGRRQFGI